jgi:uncharacterized membrane protein YbhN (UPF0104 family)
MSTLEERIQDLEANIQDAEKDDLEENLQVIDAEENSKSSEPAKFKIPKGGMFWGIAAAIPIVVALILYLSKLKIVNKRSKGKSSIHAGKFTMWVVGVSVVLWAVLYVTFYFGFLEGGAN